MGYQSFLRSDDMEYPEKRSDPREECFMTVDIAYEDKVYTDFIRNISNNGVYINTSEHIPIGRALILTYHSPQQGPKKRIGQVVWTDSGGMGIRLPKGGEF
jgi:hypothetical protein